MQRNRLRTKTCKDMTDFYIRPQTNKCRRNPMENENIDINIRPLTIRTKTFKDITEINISPKTNQCETKPIKNENILKRMSTQVVYNQYMKKQSDNFFQFSDFGVDDYIHQDFLSYNDNFDINKGKNVLEKAKNLIKKKSQYLQNSNQQPVNETTFLTGVGIFADKIEIQEFTDDDLDQPQINEDDYVKCLINENKQPYDNLEQLRKMIKQTKSNIEDYADDLYKIKKTVNDVNSGFKKIGKGVNEGVLWDVDVKFQQQMPDGNKNRIFGNKINLKKLPTLIQQNNFINQEKKIVNNYKSKRNNSACPRNKQNVQLYNISSRKGINNYMDFRDRFE